MDRSEHEAVAWASRIREPVSKWAAMTRQLVPGLRIQSSAFGQKRTFESADMKLIGLQNTVLLKIGGRRAVARLA